MRYKILSVLTDKSRREWESVQDQTMYVLCVLHLLAALDPKARIRGYATKIIQCFQFLGRPSFILSLLLSLQSCLFNSQIPLPCSQIYSLFTKIWLKNKQHQALLYASLTHLLNNKFTFRPINIAFTNTFKSYIIMKTCKLWVSSKQLQTDKSQTLIAYFQKTIIDKNKSSRFLRLKRDAILITDAPEIMDIMTNSQQIILH